MTEQDKPRFAAAMNWLSRKYPIVTGKGATREEVPRVLSRRLFKNQMLSN